MYKSNKDVTQDYREVGVGVGVGVGGGTWELVLSRITPQLSFQMA
jgi:hypothetical protein